MQPRRRAPRPLLHQPRLERAQPTVAGIGSGLYHAAARAVVLQVRYDKVLMTLGNVKASKSGSSASLSESTVYVLSLTELPGSGFPIFDESDVDAVRYDKLSYDSPVAKSSFERGPSVSKDDLALLVDNGWSLYLEGTIAKSDGESCTPGAADDCVEETTVHFAWGIDAGADRRAAGASAARRSATPARPAATPPHPEPSPLAEVKRAAPPPPPAQAAQAGLRFVVVRLRRRRHRRDHRCQDRFRPFARPHPCRPGDVSPPGQRRVAADAGSERVARGRTPSARSGSRARLVPTWS